MNPGLELFIKAFWDLCSDRYEDGHRIPWVAVQKWCEVHGLDEDDREDVHYLVRCLDITYLKWRQDKTKKPSKSTHKEPLRKKHDAGSVQ